MEPLSKSSISLTGFVFTLLGAILFSTKAIIVKKAFAETPVDALTLLTIRMIFSLPFFLVIAILSSSQKEKVRITPRQWLYIIITGMLGYYISSLFDFLGLQYISAGLERLILFLYPTFTVLINHFTYGQKITRIQKIALALTYAGIAIAYFGELKIDLDNPDFLWGSFLVFLCSITYSLYIVGSGKIIPVVGPTRFTAYAMLASTAGVFLHFLFAGDMKTLAAGADLWGYGVTLAIFATVIPSFLVSGGMKRIGINNVAIISGIGPVSTIVQAHFILGEPVFLEQIAGTLLVITGVLLSGWKKDRSE
jgi:drug/metabolite transporter (DMT)-like permease